VQFTDIPPAIAAAADGDILATAPPLLGEIVLGPSGLIPLWTGALGGSGEFVLTFPLAGVAPTFVHSPVYPQGVALDAASSTFLLSNATVATLRP